MRRKWFELVHKDENQDTVEENAKANHSGKGETVNRAPTVLPARERATTEPANEDGASIQMELLAAEDIFRAAGILSPRKGYGISKVVEMLRSDHIRGLSREMKRASVLMALDVAGISIDEVLQDAKIRQEALDAYETEQRKQFEALLARKAEENVQIQEELERVKARYAERLKRNLDSMAQEKALFGNWLTTKQQEAQNMKEAVELCTNAQGSEPAGNSLPDISLASARNKPA